MVGGELLGCSGRGVEQAKGSSDERRNFAVREAEEETLLLRPGVAGVVALLDVAEKLRLGLQPRETEVGRQRVHGTDHIGVLQVPGVLVRHPLSISEDGADLRAFAGDGAFVAAELLQTNDVEG